MIYSAEERAQEIINLVGKNRRVSSSNLAKIFGVSEVTVGRSRSTRLSFFRSFLELFTQDFISKRLNRNRPCAIASKERLAEKGDGLWVN